MSDAALIESPPRTMRVALVGNPNVGKTTLFNALTGARQKIANYPGVTVERKVGRLRGTNAIEVIDLPGSYSLNPRSMDERIAFEVLVGRRPGEAAPDTVVCVVDATNLERNLYLVSQVLDLEVPTIVALNMTDAAEKAGLRIDSEQLSAQLGVPVIPIAAKAGTGIEALVTRIKNPPQPLPSPDWELMPVVREPVRRLEATLGEFSPEVPQRQRRMDVLGALSSEELLDAWQDRAPAFYDEVLRVREDLDQRNVPYAMAETSGRYAWISPIANAVVSRTPKEDTRTLSDRIDAVVTHRIAGPLLFAGLLLLIFQAVFSWAVPAMDAIEAGVAWTGEATRLILPDGVIEDALVEGAIAGVGNVLVFLPQILLLFFFLGLMEDTGYMARTAFIMDRLMRSVGLSGSSVVPMLSAYACAIPGIMAARTLADERERIITIMVVPLQGCSARLPVYVLFIGAFVPAMTVLGPIDLQGLVMFSLYALGTGMAFVAALILRRFVFKGAGSSFVMELPPYRMPQLRMVLRRMVERAKIFVMRAGKIIFGLSIVLWFLASYPSVDPPASLAEKHAELEARITSTGVGDTPGNTEHVEELAIVDHAIQAHQMRNSFIGRFGRLLEPVMQPLGFDWKISAGIISSFAAREVIVSALATIYSAGADATETDLSLRNAIRADTYPDGRPVFTPLVAISLMVFFVFALQCMSTLAIARRELNSWKWPAIMWGYMFVLAYVFSLVVYQGGRLLGLG